MSAADVVVVGAGVSGLTTGICLAEAGARVVAVADRMPGQTTSAVAGAIWGLHSTEESERATRWGAQTLAELRALAGDPASGVRIASGVVASRPAAGPGHGGRTFCLPGPGEAERPADLAGLDGVRPCGPDRLPPGYAGGWAYQAPLAHMPAYLDWLLARFQRAGGMIEPGRAASLPEAAGAHGAPVVVNCAGAQARDLVPDPEVTALRGQVVVAENPGIDSFFIGLPGEGHDLVYLFPHGEVIVLGGTETAGDWDTEPRPALAQRILRDAAAVDPRLRGARVLAHRAGLRPYRRQVALAAQPGGDGGPLIVHNYGHGGAGVTLSWGCAREAAALALAGLR